MPTPDLGVDRDLPAALLDDPVDGREPQAGALALLLRREEGLEDARLRLGVHAGAGVDDREQHLAPGRQRRAGAGAGLVERRRSSVSIGELAAVAAWRRAR